jgi:hypothetical protein
MLIYCKFNLSKVKEPLSSGSVGRNYLVVLPDLLFVASFNTYVCPGFLVGGKGSPLTTVTS